MTKDGAQKSKSPSDLIDARIRELADWRGEMLHRLRALIKEADPEIVEEWKWRGVPVWYHDGMICTGEAYKSVVKVTFAKGASLDDPARLFNASLDGNTRRAIDIHEGETIDEDAFKALVHAEPDGSAAQVLLRARALAGERLAGRPPGRGASPSPERIAAMLAPLASIASAIAVTIGAIAASTRSSPWMRQG